MCLLSLTLAAAPAARAQSAASEELPPERWGKLQQGDVGKRFHLEGRWKEFFRPGIMLFKHEETRSFLLVPGGPGSPLFDLLVSDKDSRNQKLEKGRSVVRVTGTARANGQAVVLVVERVEKLMDDAHRFEIELAKAGDDVDAIRALTRDALARAERYGDKELRAVAQQMIRRELEVRHARLAEDDHAGRLDLAERHMEELGDVDGAIALLAEVVESDAAPEALRQRARARLDAHKAVRTRVVRDGKEAWTWVRYETFKRDEGFIQRDGRWIRREQAELLDARREELARREGRVETPRLNPLKCKTEAEAGRLFRGQYLSEVRRAVGAPVEARHLMAPLEADPRALWTQWILADGRRMYFVAPGDEVDTHKSELLSWKAAEDPWPTE